MKQGTVFNIQKFCVNDGPGIRTTVFLKGCPLGCIWCHNPESQRTEKEIVFYKHKCTGCGRCAGLTTDDTEFLCYNSAKEICGKKMSVDDVLREVLKDKIFYKNSGGGMTLSGGEPLYQFDFALALLKAAKEEGIHTAIETCGAVSLEKILAAAEYTDLFLYDFKESDSARHKEFTGVTNELILKNLAALSDAGKSIILRCPIIPGCNDRDEHFKAIADTANALDGVLHIEIEPYHPLGEGKYEAVGREGRHFEQFSDEKIEKIIETIRYYTSKKVKKA
ncbi:MAG: glycyl-radical enzyme activating protein [Clostridia bacterium]|nr:glycyl-radical enzyme activating protein [Clostridia bacterium]